MHDKGRVTEVEQAWSWRLRLGVISRVAGDNLNEEVGTGNLCLDEETRKGYRKAMRESPNQAQRGKGMETGANTKSQKQA